MPAVLLGLCLAVPAACAEPMIPAPPWGLPALMGNLAQVHTATARFVERRYLQVMKTPLQSSGVLRYVAPDQLDKQTLLPQPSRLAVAGDRLAVERPGESTQIVSLREHPDIATLVAGVRATMAGDLATLTRFFTVSLQGDSAAWTLSLEPRDGGMRAIVAAIRIDGSGASLARIETREGDGDRSEMTIDTTTR